MTRIYGYTLVPESGEPQPGARVGCVLHPSTRPALQGPVAIGAREVISDSLTARWELNLLPTAGSGRVVRIASIGLFEIFADIPVAVTGGAGDTSAIDVSTLLVDPTTLGPLPNDPSVYLPRVLLGAANGVASLGADGTLTLAQRPPDGGSIGAPVAAGAELDVTITSRWGIDPAGLPYYNAAGADPADAAMATLGADGLIHLTDTRGGVVTVAVTSVNGHTGATVVVTKTDVGLGSADNVSDVNKPVSTAQAAYATSRAVAMALVFGP